MWVVLLAKPTRSSPRLTIDTPAGTDGLHSEYSVESISRQLLLNNRKNCQQPRTMIHSTQHTTDAQLVPLTELSVRNNSRYLSRLELLTALCINHSRRYRFTCRFRILLKQIWAYEKRYSEDTCTARCS